MSIASQEHTKSLRRGWTTGCCATAATRSACHALLTGVFLDPVSIELPRGEKPEFSLALRESGPGWARAGIIKDAGDDPDVTHGALIIATLRQNPKGTGISFRAGKGVGIVTRPGLPVPPGEPAINPVPRTLMREVVLMLTKQIGAEPDMDIEISVPTGESLAQKTWNPRLGIRGGISILGTTGIVHPFSCSAWIHAIHRGIDVARAQGLSHLGGTTGSTSERALQNLYHLPESALIDMGDFVGGMLKYLRTHPVDRLSIAGGIGKMIKLAQGHLDLHSGRSHISFETLAQWTKNLGAAPAVSEGIAGANTALEAYGIAQETGLPLLDKVAELALETARRHLLGTSISLDVLVIDREGNICART